MKKRIVELENEKTAVSLDAADFFLVDNNLASYKLSKAQLFSAVLMHILDNIELSINGVSSNLFKVRVEDTSAENKFSVSFDADTSEIVVNLDTDSIDYRLDFKDGAGEVYAGADVNTLEFTGFFTEYLEQESVLRVSSQDQRAYVATILEAATLSKTSANICQLAGNYELLVSRDWAGKVVMVSDNNEDLVILKDAVSNEIIVDIGKLSQSRIKMAEVWWDSYNSRFTVLTLSRYE